MVYKKLSKIGLGVLLSSSSLFGIDASNGAKVIDMTCVACHAGNVKDGLSRISDQRKTPEGWYMTINRMKRLHGLSLSANDEQDVIKYLSDNHGLTPDEIKPYSYVLDKKPNHEEVVSDPLLGEMCVRCHSEARIGLQKRTADEWDSLVNFHVGQFISFEVQALSRDRDWFGIAQNEIVPYLEKFHGKNEKTWSDYKESMKDYKLPLDWTFYGHSALKGDFSAELKLIKSKDEAYLTKFDITYEDGTVTELKGSTIVYSGSELRVSLEDKTGKRFQQILHLDPQNSTIEGRFYETLHSELGSVLKGVASANTKTTLQGVYPKSIKAGDTKKVTIIGSNLTTNIRLSNNYKILKVISKSKNKVELLLKAKKQDVTEAYNLTINDKVYKNSMVIYDKIDYIKVTPDYAIARTGGDDQKDKILKEYASLEAIGYTNGKDGKKGTEDDIKLGAVSAIWNMKAYNEKAEEDKDVLFAGSINRYTGLFTPSEAGPNPTRKLMANNVGNLTITATYLQDNEKLEAEAHLIATVPKYINPPIN